MIVTSIRIAAASPPGVPERAFVHHSGGGTRHRQIPGDAGDRFHRPQPDGPGRPSLRPCQGSAVRGRQRPHLGRHPLPLRRRGRGGDRQEDGEPGARSPLPEVEALGTTSRVASLARHEASLCRSRSCGRLRESDRETGRSTTQAGRRALKGFKTVSRPFGLRHCRTTRLPTRGCPRPRPERLDGPPDSRTGRPAPSVRADRGCAARRL